MTTVCVKNGERGYMVALGTSSDREIDFQYENQQLLKAARRRGLETEIDCAILELPVSVAGVSHQANMGTIDLEESRAIVLNIPFINTSADKPSSIHCLLTNDDYGKGWQFHDKIILEYGDDTDFVGRTFVQKLSEFTQ